MRLNDVVWDCLTYRWQFNLEITDRVSEKMGKRISFTDVWLILRRLERDDLIESKWDESEEGKKRAEELGARRRVYRKKVGGKQVGEQDLCVRDTACIFVGV